ncbi:hypothetical protein LTR85_000722 [Meristemomyces frigidus]|nr:hypothetical protein LTR85_000722 [Meristemomyces frigidus]
MLRGIAHEMFFVDDAICELGEAYENLLFGGIPMLCQDQNVLHSWPWTKEWMAFNIERGKSTAKLHGSLPELDVKYAIAPSDVQKIFMKAYWAQAIAAKAERVELTVTGAVIADGARWQPLLHAQILRLIDSKQRGTAPT